MGYKIQSFDGLKDYNHYFRFGSCTKHPMATHRSLVANVVKPSRFFDNSEYVFAFFVVLEHT